MFGSHFYNEGIRRLTIGFGQLFNNVIVQNKSSTGAVTKRYRVPLAYAPKEKFLVRLDEQANLNNREFAVTLPRMGFEMTGLSYDSTRKLNKMQKFKQVKTGEDGKVMDYNYTPVPYNVNYTLNIFTATAENGLIIVEQILPFFQPDYTVTVNMVPDLNIKRDVPIVLNSVDYQDSYDGSFTNRRAVIYTLQFTAKTYLFGPMANSKVIKEVQDDLYTDTEKPPATREERIIITPNPANADADDDFGFTTQILNFSDGKNYNPSSDTDE
nr:proximal tail sheath stabilization [uncultured Mediterranean phage uvMED]|tara:strand:+ start:60 stop:866 length:807 start_codon:yes stop_codon:yes gene_type:complete